MKTKQIVGILLIIVSFSCSFETSKKERIIQLKYTVKGEPVVYETEYASIVFEKIDIIENIRNYLRKNEQYNRQVFLDYLLQTNDIIILSPDTVFSTKSDTISTESLMYITLFGNDYGIERDTIIQVVDESDIRNFYVEPMFWCAYELIRKGKCEIISKVDSRKIERIKIVYNKEPFNTKYTEFFFENDTLFFSALTQIGL